jgi:hypothetical protein
MVMDPERRAKVAQLKMQSGLCTVNEARRDFDMPSVQDGDEPMASANLMTLKALIAKSDAATTLKPGTYTVQGGGEGLTNDKNKGGVGSQETATETV